MLYPHKEYYLTVKRNEIAVYTMTQIYLKNIILKMPDTETSRKMAEQQVTTARPEIQNSDTGKEQLGEEKRRRRRSRSFGTRRIKN